MSEYTEKEIVQAILIVDNNTEYFRPILENNSAALLKIVNVAVIDYALEALNRCGIKEVLIYASTYIKNLKDHIKERITTRASWSIDMTVNVIGSEGARCFGDAMRDIDARALIRGNFIIMGADTVFNCNLQEIFNEHKKRIKYDKGAAATVIFKKASTRTRTGNEIMIAIDSKNNRLLYHQRLMIAEKEINFRMPLELFLENSQVKILHNIIDPQIAIGSPSMLTLFTDNFDFETRDDFVRGIIINEEILDSRIYATILPKEQYARKVNNWLSYQTVSQDIINRWVYPLVPDMGITHTEQQYHFQRNNIYKSLKANSIKATCNENVVINQASSLDLGTTITSSVIGSNCKIGQNCQLSNAFLMDNIIIEDNCILDCCVIDSNVHIGANTKITEGTIIGANAIIPTKTNVYRELVYATEYLDKYDVKNVRKLGSKAFSIEFGQPDCNEDVSEADTDKLNTHVAIKISKLLINYEDSDYDETSSIEESIVGSPLPDDANLFYSEVLDSLECGYTKKSNPDFLILEINSSRYAYNMSLSEANFYVVKAVFSLQTIKDTENNNILTTIQDVFKRLGSVVANYIKTQDAMLDCLKALECICMENQLICDKISQIIYFLYGKDFLNEDAITGWHADLNNEEQESLKKNMQKLISWFEQASSTDDDKNDDDKSSTDDDIDDDDDDDDDDDNDSDDDENN